LTPTPAAVVAAHAAAHEVQETVRPRELARALGEATEQVLQLQPDEIEDRPGNVQDGDAQVASA